MIEDLKANKFGTHAYPLQLADGSLHLLHSAYIPDKVWSEIEAVREQIVEGKIKIEPMFDAVRFGLDDLGGGPDEMRRSPPARASRPTAVRSLHP